MMEGSRETTEGIRNLDAGRVAKGMSLMIGGFATLALPGSASQIAKMIDETVSRAKAALADIGADAASASGSGKKGQSKSNTPDEQSGSSDGGARAKFFTLPNSSVPLPTKIGKKNFREDYKSWFETEGKALIEEKMKNRLRKIEPGESFIWRNLSTANSRERTRKINGLKGKRLRQFEWDHKHGEIEVFDNSGKHLGAMDPITGKMIKDPKPGRKIKRSADEQASTIRAV